MTCLPRTSALEYVKRPVRRLMSIMRLLRNNRSPIKNLDRAYRRLGIGNYMTPEASGETFLVGRALVAFVNKKNPLFVDVGANYGNYTLMLLRAFPGASIISFEPVPETYLALQQAVYGKAVRCLPLGLSDRASTSSIFDYGDASHAAHASVYADVLQVLHKASKIREIQINLTTLDEFCSGEKIEKIDFLKVDTEGNELAVLRGAANMISSGSIPLIQFEFNEMNVISRVFLKDFYDTLKDYSFYRLMPTGLLSLGSYNSRNEIFRFQNILALKSGGIPSESVARFLVG